MQISREYLNTNEPINLFFQQNKDDFIVEELQNIKYSTRGRFAIIKIKKVNMTTWDMVKEFSSQLKIEERLVGYAGLKDKHATTFQYLSFPAQFAKEINRFKHKNVEVLELNYCDTAIQKGDLVGNKFTIRLHDVYESDLPSLYQNLSHLQKHGIPNYFGYQRFGFDDKYEQSQAIAYGEESTEDKKLEHMMVSIYQSYIFNSWLVKRVELSKEQSLKKLLELDGDIYEDKTKQIVTGLMPGAKVPRSKGEAGEIEAQFDDPFVVDFKGYRRNAWMKPTNIKNKFEKETGSMMLEFELPSSCYATVVIEALINKNLDY